MPGYILHLTAARMYLDHLPSSDPLSRAAEYLKVFDREDLLRFLEAASIEAVSIRGGVSGDGASGMSRRIQSADEIPGQKKAAMSERP